jgi:hypothetical protein
VKRLVAWVGGTAVGIAAYRLLRRPPEGAPESAPPETDDRADELRAKLAESREVEPEDAGPETELESPAERRQRVHEEGRAALDDMKSDGAA